MKYKTARYKHWNLTFTETPLKPLFFLFMKYKTGRYKHWNLTFYWNVPEALIFFIYEVQNCPVQAFELHFLLERP